MAEKDNYTRILIPVKDSQISGETTWAVKTDRKNVVRLSNMPVMTDVCCIDDLVEVDDLDKKDGFPTFVKVVESVRCPVWLTYDTEDIPKDDIRKMKEAFVKECGSHDIKVSWVASGIAILAVPTKNYAVLCDKLEDIAEASGMELVDMEFYIEDEEDNQEQYLDNLEKKIKERLDG